MPALPRRALAVVGVSVVVGACAGGTPEERTTDPPSLRATETTTADDAPTAAPTPAAPSPAPSPSPPAPSTVDVRVSLEPFTTVEEPTAMAVRPGEPHAVYLAERPGRVRVVRDGTLVPAPVLDLSEQTTTESERGLLGIAFEADGATLYVSHTDGEGDSRLAAYTVTDDGIDPASRRGILAVDQPYANHNGGDIALGPDGHLYYGLGDGGAAGDPEGNGQDISTLLGALLRIDPDGGDPYAIPDDNPFIGDEGARAEIWAYGLRNPWRFSFDRDTGDLWIADVGQGSREELDFVPAGAGAGWNFGWDRLEGTLPFEGDPPPDAVPPVHEYGHTEGRCSVTGGRVYRGSAIPDLVGVYVYGDFCSGELRGLRLVDGEVVDDAALGPTVPALVAVGEDADGELYTLSLDGDVSRIVP